MDIIDIMQQTSFIIYLFLIVTILLIVIQSIRYYSDKFIKNSKEQKRKKLKSLIVGIESIKIRNRIIKKLRKVDNLLIFEELYIEDNSLVSQDDIVEIISKLVPYYKNKSDIEKVYFSHLLSFIKISSDDSEDFLNHIIKTENLICIDNVMLITLKQGNYHQFIARLKLINNNKIDYSAKLLSDQMIQFTGDKEVLASELLKEYSRYNSNIRCAIIIYCRYIKYKKSEDILKILKQEDDKECRIAIIRYFSVIKIKDIDKTIMEIGNETNDYEYKVVINQTLENFNNSKVIEYLSSYIEDENYHVRSSAIKSLDNMIDINIYKGKYSEEVDRYIDSILSEENKKRV